MWWGWVTAPILAANLTAIRRQKAEGNKQEAEGSSEAQSIQNPKLALERSEGSKIQNRTELPSLNWAIATVLLGGALLFTPLWREANPLVPAPAKVALSAATPSKLATFLKEGSVPAPIFNYMEWGGYLEWELYPTYQMFIDGRFEARKVEVWKDYLSISKGRADWQNTLDRYGVRTLILNKEFHSDPHPLRHQIPPLEEGVRGQSRTRVYALGKKDKG